MLVRELLLTTLWTHFFHRGLSLHRGDDHRCISDDKHMRGIQSADADFFADVLIQLRIVEWIPPFEFEFVLLSVDHEEHAGMLALGASRIRIRYYFAGQFDFLQFDSYLVTYTR